MWSAAPEPRAPPRGLRNVGNSCYANSLVQALLSSRALVGWLLSGDHAASCARRRSGDWCGVCGLEDLAREAHADEASGAGCDGGRDASRDPLDPRRLLANSGVLSRLLGFGRQEDSHEFLMQLLECMDPGAAGCTIAAEEEPGRVPFLEHQYGGVLRHEVTCAECGATSRTHERSLTLCLDVGDG